VSSSSLTSVKFVEYKLTRAFVPLDWNLPNVEELHINIVEAGSIFSKEFKSFEDRMKPLWDGLGPTADGVSHSLDFVRYLYLTG